jgi:arylformamidase
MGHSAGAHLVSLLAADPAMALTLGARRWLGTVSLDSAALDVEQIMQGRHAALYDRAFGIDPKDWRAASPSHLLKPAGTPFLAVCSTRPTDACPQARQFAAKATATGTRAQVLERDLSHRDINELLGREPNYTSKVELFLVTLDPSVAKLLPHVSKGQKPGGAELPH